jgi:dienelactone hydrolase
VLARLFHAWERRLAAASDADRRVRPFEWGLDWITANGPDPSADPLKQFGAWTDAAMADSDHFYACPPTDEYEFDGEQLRFPSAFTTPHPENNLVRARLFPAAGGRSPHRRAAVLVLPHWNADEEAHVGLCRLLARLGLTTLRLSLPYHDARMPPELGRADYIVSANVGRTVQVCRQAVLDGRRALAWLDGQGYTRLGILGTSLGSCLAMLIATHEPLVQAAALNHISPFFADVVWTGLSTSHVRQGLDGHITLDQLRRCWLPISPLPFIERARKTRVLLVYARYDLTFPVQLSRRLVTEFRRAGIAHNVAVLPCGHYTTGVAPFSWLDGFILTRFLVRNLQPDAESRRPTGT